MKKTPEKKTLNCLPCLVCRYAKKLWESLKYLLLALLFYMIFHKPIESFLNSFLVDDLLSKVGSDVWNDVHITILSFGLLIYFCCNRKGYTSPPFTNIQILAFSTIIYLFYRFSTYFWNFTPFSKYPPIKYLDILLLVLWLGNILRVCSRAKAKGLPENGPASFISDEPIEDVGKDLLGYPAYAEMIADKILISHFKKTFAIGITGKWGLGKTTFLNYLKNNLETNNTIIIDFNPWNSQNPSAIIKDFFETVRENKKLKQNNYSLSRSLLKYSESLLSLNENYGTRLMQVAISDITKSKPISQLFNSINEDIKSLNKKLIIFIDDIDRLDSDEIVEVLRLIRNTANFYNTYFIVGYDRNYIITALSKHNVYPHELFLEKIFQLEVTLPHFNKQVLIDRLKSNLKDILLENIHAELNEIIPSPTTYSEFVDFLEGWLDNMRDVVRLSNGLLLNIKDIEGEVVLSEFIKLEILRLKFPAVYELLYRKEDEFFKDKDDLFDKVGLTIYRLRLIKGEDKDKSKESVTPKTNLEVYIANNFPLLSVPKHSIEKIVELVCDVFPPDTKVNNTHKPHHLSVTISSKFDRYFSYQMSPDSLRYTAFTKARRSESENFFNKKIEEWVSQGFQADLRRYFEDIKYFDNRKDFEIVISAIFHFARIPKGSKDSNRTIGYSLNDIISKLDNTNEKLNNSIYSKHNNGEEGLRSFIRRLFAAANFPHTLELAIICHTTRLYPDCKFLLPQKELIEFATGYLEKFCQGSEVFDRRVCRLFYGCKEVTLEKNNNGTDSKRESLSKESIEIFKSYIKKDYGGFLKTIIITNETTKRHKLNERRILEIWKSWQELEAFLNDDSETESEYIVEFKKFYYKVKQANFDYIDFYFQKISIGK